MAIAGNAHRTQKRVAAHLHVLMVTPFGCGHMALHGAMRAPLGQACMHTASLPRGCVSCAVLEPKHLQPSAAERQAGREEVQAHLVALTTLACHCLHSAAAGEGGDSMLPEIARASVEVMAWGGFRDTRVAAGLLHVAALQHAAGRLREATYVYFSCHYRWDDWRQLSKVCHRRVPVAGARCCCRHAAALCVTCGAGRRSHRPPLGVRLAPDRCRLFWNGLA